MKPESNATITNACLGKTVLTRGAFRRLAMSLVELLSRFSQPIALPTRTRKKNPHPQENLATPQRKSKANSRKT
jgi:hypothetical protein